MRRRLTAALLTVGWLAAQDRFVEFGRDLERESPGAQAKISESGHVVWRHGAAKGNHATPVWSSQEYHGERMLWSYQPPWLMVKLPNKQLELTVSADFKAAH